MADLWTDYTDFVIDGIDKGIGKKYKVSLRDLLTDPQSYASDPNIQNTIKSMGDDVNAYVDQALSKMAAQKQELDDNLTRVDSVTKQLAQSISMQAKQNRVPFIVPISVDRDDAKEEAISVDSAGSDVLALIEKIVSGSNFIADFTTQYDNSLIGNWFFSGQKNYTINVYMPDNDVISLQGSRAELLGLLDAASALISGF
ncbi:hypothetical protein B2A_03155 [mine drainage metagenome]|uniref:Uncharacterized protein n=1 Tax=mine drainage metagenome TaxID=410659 RepID=T1AM27_9ZZZZ